MQDTLTSIQFQRKTSEFQLSLAFQYEAKTNVGRKEIICPCDCDMTIGGITYKNLNLHGADSLLKHHPEQVHT